MSEQVDKCISFNLMDSGGKLRVTHRELQSVSFTIVKNSYRRRLVTAYPVATDIFQFDNLWFYFGICSYLVGVIHCLTFISLALGKLLNSQLYIAIQFLGKVEQFQLFSLFSSISKVLFH